MCVCVYSNWKSSQKARTVGFLNKKGGEISDCAYPIFPSKGNYLNVKEILHKNRNNTGFHCQIARYSVKNLVNFYLFDRK